MAGPYLWEDILRTFAGPKGGDAVISRDDVAGLKSPIWLGTPSIVTSYTENANYTFDLWAEWTFKVGVSDCSTVVGIDLPWHTQWDAPDGSPATPWANFCNAEGTIVSPLLETWPVGNGTVDGQSFINAAALMDQTDSWLNDAIAAADGWATTVDGDDTDFQGSAAGRLKEALIGVKGEFQQLYLQVGPDYVKGTAGTISQALTTAGTDLNTTLAALGTAANSWKGHVATAAIDMHGWKIQPPTLQSHASPYPALLEAFQSMISKLTLTPSSSKAYSTNGTFSGGIAPDNNEAFMAAMDRQAKDKWLAHVVSDLDGPANIAVTTSATSLTAGYGAAYRLLPKLIQPTMILPTDPPVDPPGAGGPKDGGAGGPKDGGTGGGPPPPKTKDATPPPPPKVSTPGPPKVGGGGIGGGGAGGPGSQVPLLGKDGKQLVDKNGKPEFVPAGTTVNDKGELIGPDGKPLLGADGKPRYVPVGTTVGKATLSPTGPVLRLPVGSKLNADGTVTGPDGKPLLDSNGNPVVLAKGDTIRPDGSVVDANGKPVSEMDQLLSDEEHAFAAPAGGLQTGGGGGTGYTGPPITVGGLSGMGGLGSFGGGSFGGSSGSSSGGSGSELLSTGGGSSALGPTFGVGGRVASGEPGNGALSMESATGPAAEEQAAAAEKAAAASAAEEAELTGRSVATTGGAGGSMMPPMGGAGMGGAGAQGQGGQDRQRTTWLAEDEEVWGTESGAVSGVIGR
ncbi:hypothetical protein [Kitasatospora mediocidica]|uniref:hypothetical protein n=1 Tax=Kitasatospora mediocidica TaxID=58352 RepID=UPI000566D914|nr:hypothetical protein [Kitasatospora mediocidica]